MKGSGKIIALLCGLIAIFQSALFAAEAKPAWQATWEKTLAAAKKEGKLNFYVGRYGRLPSDDDLAKFRRSDVAAFLPAAQFRYRRELEPPDASEGFSRVDVVPFVRRHDPDFVNRAVIVACDDVGDLVRIASRLREFRDDGYRLLGISWQPEIAEGKQSEETVKAMFARECERLGLNVEVECCPHAAGPPQCWCRKPLPGLGVLFVKRHRLDPGQCIYVGTGPHDSGFARRLGFTFRDAGELAVLGNGDNTAV